MNDRTGYDAHNGQPPQLLGYDEWGRPVYGAPAPASEPQQDYAPPRYEGHGEQAWGWDAQAAPAPQPPPQQHWGPPGEPAGGNVPGPRTAEDPYAPAEPPPAFGGETPPAPQYGQQPHPTVPPQAAPYDERDYHTAQFTFVDEQSEESEDVIDWLKFTESRTERREEAKRRGRSRKRALAVLLALVLLGTGGYLWWAGRIPGLGDDGAGTPAAAQKRDVLVVHLRDVDARASSTALLVDNTTTGRATTLLLPDATAVTTADGESTTLAASVEDEGDEPTRTSLGELLGTDIKGTWRLDTPFLENLVDSAGGVSLDADVTVPGEEKGDEPLVRKGEEQELGGRAAAAYATYTAKGEPDTARLERFGQVMAGLLERLPADEGSAVSTVEALGQVLTPPLTPQDLGATLATLADRAQGDAYRTELLPVGADGTLSGRTGDGLVKDVLGGTVDNADPADGPRIAVRDGSGGDGAGEAARVALVNGGFTVVGAPSETDARATSQVTYRGEDAKVEAQEVAATLGLPVKAVREDEGVPGADVTVVLGADYEPAGS